MDRRDFIHKQYHSFRHFGKIIIVAFLLIFSVGTNVYAENDKIHFNIPSQPISSALDDFVKQTQFSLVFKFDGIQHLNTADVLGVYSPIQAMEIMLLNTGFTAKLIDTMTISIRSNNRPIKKKIVPTPLNNSNIKESNNKLVLGVQPQTKPQQLIVKTADQVKIRSYNEYTLEDTLVTATKMGKTLNQKTPLAITAYDFEELEARSSFNLTDLAYFSPNTNIWSDGGSRTYYIRGIGSDSNSYLQEPNVGIYMDGVYMERGFATLSDFVDVQRVEILRGPQGTLYGRNNTGGAINIITKMPTKKLEINLAQEIGSFEKLRTDISIAGPIVKDRLMGRAAASLSRWNGHYVITEGPTDQENSLNSIRGTLDFKFSDTFDLILRADYQEYEYNTPGGKLLTNTGLVGRLASIDLGLFPDPYVLPKGFYNVKLDHESRRNFIAKGVSGTITWEMPSNTTVKSITAYREFYQDMVRDNDGTNADLYNITADVDTINFSQEFQITGSHGATNWLAGIFYYHLEEDFFLTEDIPPFSNENITSVNYETDAYALFANIDHTITDKLSLGAGIRYSFEKKMTSEAIVHDSNGNIIDGDVIPLHNEWDAITPRAIAKYMMTDHAMIYASITNGFRAGTFYPWNSDPIPVEIDPETNWSYETGIKSDWFDRRLRINATGFISFYDDMQVSMIVIDPDTGFPITGIQNAASARISGAELEVKARPFQALTLNLTVGYLDARFDSFPNAIDISDTPTDLSGNRLPFSPKWQGAFGAQYIFDFGKFGFLNARGDITCIDDVYFNHYNDKILSRDPLTLVNAYLRYERTNASWSVEVYGKNLTDEEYYNTIGRLGGRDEMDLIGDPAPPATYGFRLIFSF